MAYKLTKKEVNEFTNEELLNAYLQINKELTTIRQTQKLLKYDQWLREEILKRMK